MPWPSELTTAHLVLFTFVLARVGGLVAMAPLFSSLAVPMQVRALIGIALAMLLFPTQWTSASTPAVGWLEWLPLVAVEILIGLILGLATTILLAGFQLAGQLVSQVSGLSLAEVVDPSQGTSMPIGAQLLGMFSVAVYLLVGGHRVLLAGLLRTFVVLPPGAGQLPMSVNELLLDVMTESFSLGVRAAAPAVLAVLLATLVLALVSRTLPQLNILSVGFGLNTLVALGTLAATLGSVAWLLDDELEPAVRLLMGALASTAT